MSEPRFTAAPWTVDEEAFDNDGFPETVIRALGGKASVAFAIDFGSNNPLMREANARLIAAAPELFAALKAMVDDHFPDLPLGEQARRLNMADAAIAKALGDPK